MSLQVQIVVPSLHAFTVEEKVIVHPHVPLERTPILDKRKFGFPKAPCQRLTQKDPKWLGYLKSRLKCDVGMLEGQKLKMVFG